MELSRKTVLFWRTIVQSQEFMDGIVYLRKYHSPKMRGETEGELLKNALSASGYNTALDDLEEVLTVLPQKEKPIEQPGLEA